MLYYKKVQIHSNATEHEGGNTLHESKKRKEESPV